jgi:hypothetical protein
LDDCIAFTKDPLKRARKILYWVQNNMNAIGYNHDLFNSILKTRRASYLQIACLCNKLFNSAGLESDIVFTFNKNDFILDTTFLFYARYVITAMPVVTINGKTYVTYPYLKGYELGEYPLGYNGALCINPFEKEIYPLPPAQHGDKWIRDRMVLDISSFPGKYTLIREYKKNSASAYRYDFLTMKKGKRRGEFEDILKEYNESNKVESFSFEHLKKYEKPLIAKVSFTNNDGPIPYENKKIFKLNNFFPTYFEDITQDRTEDVINNNQSIYIDEIEVKKIPGKNITCDITMTEKANELFTSVLKKSETDTSYIYTRTLICKIAHIHRSQIQKLYNDCEELNSIKNSSIIIH